MVASIWKQDVEASCCGRRHIVVTDIIKKISGDAWVTQKNFVGYFVAYKLVRFSSIDWCFKLLRLEKFSLREHIWISEAKILVYGSLCTCWN